MRGHRSHFLRCRTLKPPRKKKKKKKEAPTTRTRGSDPFAELSPMHMCNLSDSLAIPLNLKKKQNDLVGTKLQLRCMVVKAEERRPVLQV